jgi:ankyrin repeat protein
MPELPVRPSLEHLKNQARKLLQQALAHHPAAAARLAAAGVTAPPKLADALHVIAREHGFATWPALKLHVEAGSADAGEALAAALAANDPKLAVGVLARHPALRGQLDQPLPGGAFGATPLLTAVQKNNRTLVDALLDAGADVNARSQWWAGGFGVLDCAAPDLAGHLIARGARVDIHAAARLGKPERVRELLREDPSRVHARGGDGQLPLHFAATVEIAALLLEHGAEVDARDIDHESTAAQYMVCARRLEAWQEAARHEVARHLIARGASADLLMAAALGDLMLVERILNDDPETVRMTVNERWFPKRDPRSGGCIYFYGFGMTAAPHMVARLYGHAEVHALLMQRSPNWLRLAQAAEAGDAGQVEAIVRRHPELFRRLTAHAARRIIGAAGRNNTRAVELLLGVGWPANAELDNHQTALHYAAWNGNLAMVRALLAHNAPVRVFENEHGGSPLAWALHGSLHNGAAEAGDYPAVVEALLAAGAVIPAPDQPLQASDAVLEVLARAAQP